MLLRCKILILLPCFDLFTKYFLGFFDRPMLILPYFKILSLLFVFVSAPLQTVIENWKYAFWLVRCCYFRSKDSYFPIQKYFSYGVLNPLGKVYISCYYSPLKLSNLFSAPFVHKWTPRFKQNKSEKMHFSYSFTLWVFSLSDKFQIY